MRTSARSGDAGLGQGGGVALLSIALAWRDEKRTWWVQVEVPFLRRPRWRRLAEDVANSSRIEHRASEVGPLQPALGALQSLQGACKDPCPAWVGCFVAVSKHLPSVAGMRVYMYMSLYIYVHILTHIHLYIYSHI